MPSDGFGRVSGLMTVDRRFNAGFGAQFDCVA